MTIAPTPWSLDKEYKGRMWKNSLSIKDADGDHVESMRVEIAQDAARGHARDGVLVAAAAENNGDSHAVTA